MSDIFLVHGPPGTGKTTYLSRQARRAVEQHGPEQVAIASLTRAAAAEIAGRDTGIPDEHVGTLHAACFHALDRPDTAEKGPGLKAWNDAHPAYALTGGPVSLEDAPIEAEAGTGRTLGDQLQSAVMCHRARRTPRDAWTDDERAFDAAWTDYKTQTGRVDFTDLIEQAIDELPSHPAAPAVLLLDEVQDFSALELALAQRWAAAAKTTVLAGDVDQALYQWRGSDPEALLAMPVTDQRVLAQSYRVPAAVHGLADAWIRQVAHRADVAYHPTDQAGQARHLPISLRSLDLLMAEIAADVDAGRTVMILTACGYQLAPVLGLLRRNGMPFHNPYRVTQGQWNPMRAAGRLLAFLAPKYTDRPSWTWDELRRWTEPLQARGILTRGSKSYIEQKCRADRYGDHVRDQVPDAELVASFFEPAACERLLRLDVDWWADHLLAKDAKTARYPVDVLRRHGLPALDVEPPVITGTIHSVKGGEADSVYVFPDLSRAGQAGWQAGGVGRDQIVRMFYVALTRAKERVTILDPSGPEHVPLQLLGAGDRAPEKRRAALGPVFAGAAS